MWKVLSPAATKVAMPTPSISCRRRRRRSLRGKGVRTRRRCGLCGRVRILGDASTVMGSDMKPRIVPRARAKAKASTVEIGTAVARVDQLFEGFSKGFGKGFGKGKSG